MMSNNLMMFASPVNMLKPPVSTSSISSSLLVEQKNYATKLLPLDILCGSDKRFEQHPGNLRYQQILNKMRAGFLAMESKSAKKKMVRDIDEFIASYGGRFLRIDESTGRLRVMTTAESRNKISRSLRENVSPQKSRKVYVAKVTELDVMCGRGGEANHHLGNKLYRKLVGEMKEKYRNTGDKDEKTDLSRSIVDQVCDYGGRFVKKDSAIGRYYVLTKAEARIKTSQALRENRDSRNASSTDADDSDCDEESKAPSLSTDPDQEDESRGPLDTDSLDCCQALVSLSRAGPSPVTFISAS